MVISTVPLFHAMSLWAVALDREFGWNRTQLGLALTFFPCGRRPYGAAGRIFDG
ncbi:MAG: hypothetical protein CM1200mP22_21350 [Dehalococcoidia bacterium]|nr:MAG: hypothetical protein CM1200mP22_21350 [Dehalococcoidia bacterium]